jgi:hypothetical protein
VLDGDGSGEQRAAAMIAECCLRALTGGPGEVLLQGLEGPTEQLVMGVDGQPYLVTVVTVRRTDGAVHLQASVRSGGWGRHAAVVRTAVVLLGADDGSPRQPPTG